MAGQLSPDGKWLWDGNQWIPAPPQPLDTLPVPLAPMAQSAEHHPKIATYGIADPLFLVEDKTKKRITKNKVFAATGVVLLLITSISVWVYFVNSESCVNVALTSEKDEPIGGIIDSTTTYVYTENGLITLEEEISWDGAILDRTTYTYDNSNNLIEEYRVFETEWTREKMTYDNSGNLLTKDTQDSYSWNDDERRIYTYNSNDDLVEIEIDIDIDGVVDERTEYQYDSNGLEKSSFTDSDMDGDFDSSTTNYYDSKNRLLESKTDDGMDGSVDDITLYRYDSNGNIIDMRSDYGNDGDYEFIYVYSFDDQNRLIGSTMTIDFEGTWLDSRSNSVVDYADDGSYTITRSTFDGDEQTSTTTTTYGCYE